MVTQIHKNAQMLWGKMMLIALLNMNVKVKSLSRV